jgi:hypothetical protein
MGGSCQSRTGEPERSGGSWAWAIRVVLRSLWPRRNWVRRRMPRRLLSVLLDGRSLRPIWAPLVIMESVLPSRRNTRGSLPHWWRNTVVWGCAETIPATVPTSTGGRNHATSPPPVASVDPARREACSGRATMKAKSPAVEMSPAVPRRAKTSRHRVASSVRILVPRRRTDPTAAQGYQAVPPIRDQAASEGVATAPIPDPLVARG